MKIEKTDQYDQFRYIKGNRELNESHVRKLTAAVGSRNLLPFNPILVNKAMEVIDGQHRIEAARNNNLEVYYIVLDDGDFRDVVNLNNVTKSWHINDYLNSYVVQGKADYLTLQQFMDKYDLSVSIATSILTAESILTFHKHNRLKDYKDGSFKVTSLEAAADFMDKIQDIVPYLDNKQIAKHVEFLQAILVAERTIPHEILLEKLESGGRVIKRRFSTRDYLFDLEEIINKGVQTTQRKRLY